MDITTFQCPHCQAVLRMRRKQTGDSTFPCPDCNQSLLLSQTPEGHLSISLRTATPVSKATPDISRKAREWKASLHRGATFLMTSPVLMSWLVAGTGACLILLLMLFDQAPAPATTKDTEVTAATDTRASVSEKTESPEPAELEEPQPAPDVPPKAETPVQAPAFAAAPELIAVKPEHIPPLEAQKPLPAAPLPAPETDVAVALQIPLKEFRQPEKIPLKTLIRQLEEMLDTEFQVAENVKSDPRLLETPVSFSAKDTTLSNLLTKILSKAALTFSVKSNKIYIERAAAP
ncbi:hypothetical protein [uncultured Gimesia sp.]|uniref:DUF4974 domain-containing protein n=1 Tax=uncultured Gimesia sp. TaxID=1678688 RepID=UPI002630698F|nr:hypothetical protein [uncultured Gimesia sp.]